MKKALLIAIPVGLLAVVLVAAQSYGFGFRGHHGRHGMAKDFLMWRIDRLGEELNLNASQKAKWDTFKKDLESNIEQRMEERKDVHEAIRAEMSKENPDLTKVTPLIHRQIDDMSQLGHQLVDRIGELYSDLTPEQKKKVAETLESIHESHEE